MDARQVQTVLREAQWVLPLDHGGRIELEAVQLQGWWIISWLMDGKLVRRNAYVMGSEAEN